MSDAGETFPPGFLWGAATAAHQVEGGNVNNDWWEWEHRPGSPCSEFSGDACDHYHRYPADIALLAEVGLNAYRFSLEWSRIEPEEGQFSRAALDHYLRMATVCREHGITPVVTFHHFSSPRWLAERGGWNSDATPDLFARYCERAARHLGDSMGWACTINEPAVVATIGHLEGRFPPGHRDEKRRDLANELLLRAHVLGRDAIRSASPGGGAPPPPVGIALSVNEWEAADGGEAMLARMRHPVEDVFLDGLDGDDDFIGVQSYFRTIVGPEGRRPVPEPAETTQIGWEYRPEALAAALRRVWSATGGRTPLLVTENGVAVDDDRRRVEFVARSLAGVRACLHDGIDVRGYLYWTLIDNFEWTFGYTPRFGLLACDRDTLERTVRPSARWLGAVARANRLPDAMSDPAGEE